MDVKAEAKQSYLWLRLGDLGGTSASNELGWQLLMNLGGPCFIRSTCQKHVTVKNTSASNELGWPLLH